MIRSFKIKWRRGSVACRVLSYHEFCNEERLTAVDEPTKFVLVLGKIGVYKLRTS